MLFGMNLLLWTPNATREHVPLLERIRDWGFDGVELPLFDPDPDTLAALARELDRLHLRRTAVTICTPETNPIDPDPAIRREAVRHLKQRIDACELVGAEVLCGPFHSALGALKGRGRTEEEWRYCVEAMREVAAYAGQKGVRLSVEPLNRFEVYFLNTMADASRLVREVNHPAFGYLYDTFHANIEERDIYRSVVDHAHGLNHVHISENDRGVPGRGHVHWGATFRGLKDCGYNGWLVIEAFGRALPELAAATCIWRDLFDSEEQVATEGLAFMRAQWAAA